MQKCLYPFLVGLLSLTAPSAFGQRQELSISPVGFIHPKNQLIQYERYIASRQSLTISLSHTDNRVRNTSMFGPNRTDRFTATRGVIGYRNYSHWIIGEEVVLFGSVRAVVDYSTLQLTVNPKFNIPADSMRMAGISLAPELVFGGKVVLWKRLTLTGAIGMQHLYKLFSTDQITRNQGFWAKVNSADQENWQANRNEVIKYRQGWYPSVLVTVGAILGKRPPSATDR
jgi:hypothetical protein